MDRLQEIEQRISQIKEDLKDENSNIEELSQEFDTLKEERKGILEKREARKSLLDEVSKVEPSKVLADFELDNKEERKEDKKMEFRTIDEALQSQAYESAFTKKYTVENPSFTDDEKRALNTTNGAVLIPHQWLNTIYDQIREQHPILTDLTWNQINAIVEIPRRLSIVSGDAAVMEEGTCPLGEENEFDSIQIDLIEIQKMVEMTAKMGQLLPEAFKQWLVTEVRDRIGAKMAEQAIAMIKTDILAENKLTSAALSEADLLKLFGAADGLGVAKIYANRKTLYSQVYPLKGADGLSAYIPNYQDPIKGTVLGVEAKMESAMADGEILIVFPNEVFFNVPGGIRVKQMEDICFKLQIAGIAFMGLRLKYRKGAALLTVGAGA